jgi:hypothetical protein
MIKAIRDKLVNDPAVSALIGSRVYDLVIPQGQPYPALVYQTISGSDDLTQDGPTGFYSSTLRLTCLAQGRGVVEDLAAAIAEAVNGRQWTAKGEVIHLAAVEDIGDVPYQNEEGRDHNTRGKQLTLVVLWSTAD